MSDRPQNPDPDQELIERSQAGETRAFDDLVRKYTPKLYGLVYNMTSNREDTADLLQDIFAKAYRSLRRFQGKSTFLYLDLLHQCQYDPEFPQKAGPLHQTEHG